MKVKISALLISLFFPVISGAQSAAHRDVPTLRLQAKLHHRVWQVQEIQSSGQASVSPSQFCGGSADSSIEFFSTGQARGRLCCNGFNGLYKVNSPTGIAFGRLAWEQVACLAQRADADVELIRIFNSVDKVDAANDKLELSGPQGRILLSVRKR